MNLARRVIEEPLSWLVGGGILGFAITLSAGASEVEGIFFAGVGAICGLILSIYVTGHMPFITEFETPLRPPEARAVVRERFGRAPWSLARDEPNELLYWRPIRPHLTHTILLLTLGIWPAVIYVAISLNRTQTIVVRTQPQPDGSTVHYYAKPSHPAGRRFAGQLIEAMDSKALESEYGFDDLRD